MNLQAAITVLNSTAIPWVTESNLLLVDITFELQVSAALPDSVIELRQDKLNVRYDRSKTFRPIMLANGSPTVGYMGLFLSTLVVPKHLKCDGAAVSRSYYQDLFNTIGTSYGAGDGLTTFNLPESPITGTSTYYIYANI